MKGIKICGECANYDWKKHKCKMCEDEGKPTDSFYADCPLPDVEEVKHGEWIEAEWNVVCSSCGVGKWKGYVPGLQEAKKWMPRCPQCGAKMDGKESKE